MTYKRKKYHKGDTHLKKGWRTKRRTKDLDEIDEDLKEENVKQLLHQEVDLDKPGAAQHYCVHCARYFINQTALHSHFTTKVHKRRLKALELEPYSIEESERASGKGSYIAPQKRKIETLTVDSDTDKISQSKKYASTLYISGRNANQTCAFLSPYLDFDERFDDIDKLQRELKLRKLNIDAIEMKKTWDFYKIIKANNITLEIRKKETSSEIISLQEKKEKTSEDEQQLAKLFLQAKIIKQDIKAVKELQWDLDETIIEKLLRLPNKLHERTPPETSVILQNVGKLCVLPENNRKSHIEIGKLLNLLEYKDPMTYYLLNDAALFEYGLLNLAGKILTNNNLIRITGSDFCRSILVEGSGLNHEDPIETFILENINESNRDLLNHMHLVGGASLASMLGIHAKQLIMPQYFPIKYYSVGRQYIPTPKETTLSGLFTVCQASAIHIFLMINDTEFTGCTTEFEKMLEIICEFYSYITDHYRVVIRSAPELQTCEQMRISFELWSSFSEQYIEVGHISMYGKYFSKRLLIGYETPEGKEFPSIISGTMLSVPRILGCLLEKNPNKFVIPPKIVEQMPFYHTIDTELN
ncbi:serine--tRNA synthetase-like protein Slimp [Vespula squamosa]|uniref:Zinc finger protein 593 homolog n=1 Tax=Vespula squamosa TaxID=30214 RepID=A0ABD2A867_VESSQ